MWICDPATTARAVMRMPPSVSTPAAPALAQYALHRSTGDYVSAMRLDHTGESLCQHAGAAARALHAADMVHGMPERKRRRERFARRRAGLRRHPADHALHARVFEGLAQKLPVAAQDIG